MPAAETAVVLALLAQVLFTVATMLRAGRARVRAFLGGKVTGDVALGQHEHWPPEVRKFANNMNNQFETPTLFYALVLLALVIHAAGPVFALLTWAYVGTRVVHAAIHTGSNRIRPRFRAFAAGVACLGAMAVVLTVAVLASAIG